MKKVSVIIPVYNVEQYVEECLESVIHQTYENLEIIIVIDGATDSSEQICRKFMIRDSRIKIIVQSNQGLSAARNTGIAASSGELLSFVDSDDFIDNAMIEKLVFELETTGAQMAVCGMYRYYSPQDKKVMGVKEKNILSKQDVLKSILSGDEIGNYVWNKLYKRELFDEIKFPVGRTFEDTFTTYKVVINCEKIRVIPDALYYYRIRQGSLSHVISSKSYKDQIDGFIGQAQDIASKFPMLKDVCELRQLSIILALYDMGAVYKLLNEEILINFKLCARKLAKSQKKELGKRGHIMYIGLMYFTNTYPVLRRIFTILKKTIGHKGK